MRTQRTIGLSLLWMCLGGLAWVAEGATIAVRSGGPVGTTAPWNAAVTDLGTALWNATAGDQIWIAAGTYRPTLDPTGSTTPADPRTLTFGLKDGVPVVGGFDAASPEADPASRVNPWLNATILDGDLGENDGPDFANRTDNAYHVVTGASMMLDGVTIRGGSADGAALEAGGGLLLETGKTMELTGVTFRENQAAKGGALAVQGATVTLRDAVFENNRAVGKAGMSYPDAPGGGFGGFGGALALWDSGTVAVNKSSFFANTAQGGAGGNGFGMNAAGGGGAGLGGAVFVESGSTFRAASATFGGNQALGGAGGGGGPSGGGGAGLGGAVFGWDSTIWLANLVCANNEARGGAGGMGGNSNAGAMTGNAGTFGQGGGAGGRVGGFGGGGGGGSTGGNGGVSGGGGGGVTAGGAGGSPGGGAGAGPSSYAGGGGGGLGGAVCLMGTGNLQVRNCSFNGNRATAGSSSGATPGESNGGGVFKDSGTLTVANSILWQNVATLNPEIGFKAGTTTVLSSLVQGGYTGTANLNLDPLFANPAGEDGVLGTKDDDFHLQSRSPAIDSGDNSLLPGDATDLDQDGIAAETLPLDRSGIDPRQSLHPRPDGGAGTPPIVDRGAFEAINHAPILDNGDSPWLNPVQKNDATSSGTPISDLLNRGVDGYMLTDADPGTAFGIALTGVDNSHGTWQYSLNGGASWANVPAGLSDSSALLLSRTETDLLRFQPAADFSGTVDPAITFRGWDGSDGLASGTSGVNTIPNGGNAPFSAASETASIEVTLTNPDVIHVDGVNGNDENYGFAWNDAKKTVQAGIDQAAANGRHQVWVKQGTYYPTAGTDRNQSFRLESGLAVYGGFAGSEFYLSERNVAQNVTVLSGDIGTTGDNSDNSCHVVRTHVSGITENARLDGFTITGGNANGGTTDWNGGGLYLENVGRDVKIVNCLITDNRAANNGGGVFLENSCPEFQQMQIQNNTANYGGGVFAVAMETLAEPATFLDSRLVGNTATAEGGGLAASDCPVRLERTTVAGNRATERGGGLVIWDTPGSCTLDRAMVSGNQAADGGGMLLENSSPLIQNSVFSGNSATGTSSRGGALLLTGSLGSSPQIVNCTLDANTAGDGGGLATGNNCLPQIRNSIFSNHGGGAIFVGDTAYVPNLNTNLFYANTPADYTDNGEHAYTGGSQINANVPATGNLDGNPLFSPDRSGTWSANPVYDAGRNVTTLTDTGATGLTGGELTGRLLQPNTAQKTQALIVGNGTTTIEVVGNVTILAYMGDAYRLVNYRLDSGSPAGGAGLGTADGAPTCDFDGNPRPGSDGTVDIGAYERTGPQDTTAPSFANLSAAPRRALPGDEVTLCFTTSEPLNAPPTVTVDGAPAQYQSVISDRYTYTYTIPANAPHGALAIVVNGADLAGNPGTLSDGVELWRVTRWYVNQKAVSSGDGKSWAQAFQTLGEAATAVQEGDTVWVTRGEYKPGPGSSRSTSFLFPAGTVLIGGFGGHEQTLSQRDGAGHWTVLSGDIGTAGDFADNSYHVLTVTGTSTLDTVVDGLFFQRGHANGSDTEASGSALLFSPGATSDRLYVSNSIFYQNQASARGGAVYMTQGQGWFEQCVFAVNQAAQDGGAIATNGGGTVQLVNSTLAGNRANSRGGAVAVVAAPLTIRNSILWQNEAPDGATVFAEATLAKVTIAYSDIDGGWNGTGISLLNGATVADGGGNVDADPQFLVPPAFGPDGVWGTADDPAPDLALWSGSPCIDAGTNGDVPLDRLDLNSNGVTNEPLPWDLGRNPRLVNLPIRPDSGNGTAPLVDLGAFEARAIYVNAAATTGMNNGSSWENGFTSLQDALMVAVQENEIRVATGSYAPGTYEGDSFLLRNGVGVYGGYVASDTTDPLLRDWRRFPTYLEGASFSRTIVRAMYVGTDALLDGFTIQNASNGVDNGGGMLIQDASPTVRNCEFRANQALKGGAVAVTTYGAGASSPQFVSCRFNQNHASSTGDAYGGAVYIQTGAATSGPTRFTNCVFWQNQATSTDGGAGKGGALYIEGQTPTITNCSFNGNSAPESNGGALFVEGATGGATLLNSILYGDTGGEIVVAANPAAVTANYSCIQGGFSGTNNISTDPLFADSATGNLRLSPGSPCIDVGLSDGGGMVYFQDFDGRVRTDHPFTANNGSGTPNYVDLGAHEFRVWFVRAGWLSGGDGSSWASPFSDLQPALGLVLPGDNVWMTEGEYKPARQINGSGPRFASFLLTTGASLVGGFRADTPESSPEARQPAQHVTLLSGDIGLVDQAGDNAFHVVQVAPGNTGVLLDGLAIRNGRADEEGANEGGGLLIDRYAQALVRQVEFRDNYAGNGGGAAVLEYATAKFEKVTFASNTAVSQGGALSLSSAAAAFSQTRFGSNQADLGGAIYSNMSGLQVTNVVFAGNSATQDGGALYVTGYVTGKAADVRHTTCSGNAAGNAGGAIYLGGGASLTLANSILWDNTAPAAAQFAVDGGTPTADHNLIQGGFDATGIIDGDALFVAPGSGDYHLRVNSPAIDAADGAFATTQDFDGRPRFDDLSTTGTGTGSPNYADFGAFEYQPQPIVTVPALTNDPTPTLEWATRGGGDGSVFRYKLDNSDLSTGATQVTGVTSITPALAHGNHSLFVQEFSAASGFWSDVGRGDVQVDTIAPTASVAYNPGRPVKQGETLTITATFTDPLQDAPVPQISIDYPTLSGIADLPATNMDRMDSATWKYELTVPAGNGVGTVSFSAGLDLAGNTVVAAPTAGATFVVDNQPPAFTDLAFGTSNGNPAYARTGDTVSVGFSVPETLQAGPTVTIGGKTATVNATRSGGATYSASRVLDGSEPEGVLVFGFAGTDLAGNAANPTFTKDQALKSITFDRTPPVAPGVTGITTDTGSSGTDGITSDTSLTVAGTAENGATVELFKNSLSLGTVVASAGGLWSFDYTGTDLPEGGWSFAATATDAAGNPSDTGTPFPVFIDTTRPTTTVSTPANNSVQNNLTLLSGTADDGTGSGVAHVGISILRTSDGKYWTGAGWGSGPVWLNASGTTAWTLGVSGATWTEDVLHPYEIQARATDPAGNVQATAATASFRFITHTVVNTEDSGPGSLRAAIDYANSHASTTIGFAIPAAGTGYNATAGTWTIEPATPLPAVTGAGTVIDGASQAAFIGGGANCNPFGPAIVINGALAGSGANGLALSCVNGTVDALVIQGFDGHGILIFDSGSGCHSNTVKNCFVGTSPDGMGAAGNKGDGIHLDSVATNVIGGTTENGNLISGNLNNGVALTGAFATGNRVEGNRIGVRRDGTAGTGNEWAGVHVDVGASGNFIGSPGKGNVIGGSGFAGVVLSDPTTTNNLLCANFIGVNALLNPVPNGVGVHLGNGAGGNRIGDGIWANRNTIAANTGTGVVIVPGYDGTGNGNRISQNSIFDNGGLGIDLGDETEEADGVTPNDGDDADEGPNRGQNFPLLTGAQTGGGNGTVVTGSLDSLALNAAYPLTLEFFTCPLKDPSGNGEGAAFLGSHSLAAPGAFAVTGLANATPGHWLAATATDDNGNTSEFSLAVEVLGLSSLTVTTPTEAAVWGCGTTQTIAWDTVGDARALVRLDLYKNDVWNSTVVGATPNDGSFSWLVPVAQTPGTDYTIYVTSVLDGTVTNTSPAFEVQKAPAPTVTAVTPDWGMNNGVTGTVTVNGTGFLPGVTVTLTRSGQSNIPATGVTRVDAGQLNGGFNLAGAAPGLWNVVVANADAQNATLADKFEVYSPVRVLGLETTSTWQYQTVPFLRGIIFTQKTVAEFAAPLDLNDYDVLLVSETLVDASGTVGTAQNTLDALAARQADLAAWVAAGHGIVALCESGNEPGGAAAYSWVPPSLVPAIGSRINTDSVHVLRPLHPVMRGLSDATLSSWDVSAQSLFVTPGGFDALAEDPVSGRPLVLAGPHGSGRIVLTAQGADLHNLNSGHRFIQNAIDWVSGRSGVAAGADTTAPTSEITAPKPGTVLSILNRVSGRADDPAGSGLARVEIGIRRDGDGQYWNGAAWAGTTLIWLTAEGLAQWQVLATPPWADGQMYTVIARARDLADNLESPPVISQFRFDTSPPLFSNLVLAANHANPAYARPGSTVSISFGVNEELREPPTVTLGGRPAALVGGGGGLRGGTGYTAERTLDGSEPEGVLTVIITGTDLAGNAGGRTATEDDGGQSVTFDASAPLLTAVDIRSNNVGGGSSWAKAGDRVTLSFTASEALATPTVMLAGQPATVTAARSEAWQAERLMTNADDEGPVAFSIAFADLAGNAGTTVAGTTDASRVTFDRTAPAGSISQAPGQTDPAHGDAVTFKVQFSETVTGLESSDIQILTGSTAAPGALVAAVSGNGATYDVEVTGMTGNGTVQVDLAANTVMDSAGNGNPAAVVVDNRVDYVFDTEYLELLDLGPAVGGSESRATGINAAGVVTGFYRASPGVLRPFLWDAGTTSLNLVTDSNWALAAGISDSGFVAGYRTDAGALAAFLWGTTSGLTPIGGTGAMAFAVQDYLRGSVQVVGSRPLGSAGQREAFAYLDGTTAALLLPSDWKSGCAYAVSRTGGIAGEAQDANGIWHALFWPAANQLPIDLDAGGWSATSTARAVNDSATVAGFRSAGGTDTRGCVWSPTAGLTDLPPLCADRNAAAAGINNAGAVVGWGDVGDSTFRAALWLNGMAIDLNDLVSVSRGLVLQGAAAINDNGWIVGHADVDGQTHAFLARRPAGRNVLPLVRWVGPAEGTVVDAGQPVQFTAMAADPDGAVAAVRFYLNGVLAGTGTAAGGPYILGIPAIAAGLHTVCAEAEDATGAIRRTELTHFQAVAGAPQANPEPYSLAQFSGRLTVAAPGVLSNDVNPTGIPGWTAELFSGVPAGHALELHQDGSFWYEPPPAFTGAVTFQYVAVVGAVRSAPATVTLTVTATAVTFNLTLKTGWSLVSVPLTPADPAVAAVFQGAVNAAVWEWDGTQYVLATRIRPMFGYWVLREGAEITIPIVGTVVANPVRTVTAGWNLIGPVDLPNFDVPVVPAWLAFPQGILRPPATGFWNGAYHEVGAFDCGFGYWILMQQAGTLRMGLY